MDGDGDADLFLGNFSYLGGVERNRLYLNDGTGTFTNQTSSRIPAGVALDVTTDVALVDITKDGALDILVGNSDSGGSRLYVNDGTGTFAEESFRLPAVHLSSSGLAVADVDLDDDRDVLSVRSGSNELFLNGGSGTFVNASRPQIRPDDAPSYDAVAGDVDGDGDVDVVFGNLNAPATLFLNDGNGIFSEAPQNMPQDPVFTYTALLGDAEGDGDLDLFLGVLGSGRLYVNDGGGVFTDESSSRLPVVSGSPQALVLGDVDADGDSDLVLAYSGSRDRLFLNDGNGVFTDDTVGRLPVDAELTRAVALGDVDVDGDPDLVLGGFSTNGSVNRLYLNDGAGVFSDATSQLPQNADATNALVLGDVDGDGDLDLGVGNEDWSTFSERNRLYRNDGTGNFEEITASHLPEHLADTHSMTLVDLERDGDLDLFVGSSGAGSSRFYRNPGDGVFVDETDAVIGPSVHTRATVLEDIDADGDLDLVVTKGVLVNLAHQLRAPLLARTGFAFPLDLYARGENASANLALVSVTSTSGSLSIPSLGRQAFGPGPHATRRLVRIPQPWGKASTSILIPDDPSLAGARVRARAWFLDVLAGQRTHSNRSVEVILR